MIIRRLHKTLSYAAVQLYTQIVVHCVYNFDYSFHHDNKLKEKIYIGNMKNNRLNVENNI